MPYKIESEQFSGPLDLLLSLIEDQKLDITKISLAQVADEYLNYVKTSDKISPEEMADFLVIAAKLILIKSRSLLPSLEIEEGEDNLESQLKLYKEFIESSKKIEKMIKQKKFSCSREKLPQGIEPEFNPPKNLTMQKMSEVYKTILNRLEPLVKLPENTIKRVISIEERIRQIHNYISKKVETTFHELVGKGDKVDKIVSFLALLELVKQRSLVMDQDELFSDIFVKRNGEGREIKG